MAEFSAFRPYVMPEVPGCPQIMVDDAIRDACRRFSADTWLITYDVPLISTVAGTQDYTLTAPAQHEVFAIQTVVKNGVLPALSPSIESTANRYAQYEGSPQKYWLKSGKMWLFPTPDAISSLAVEAVIRPLQTAITVDNQYVEFREAISCWAKYKLMLSTGKVWYNPTMAKEYHDTYVKLTGEEQIRQSSGRVAANLRAQADFF